MNGRKLQEKKGFISDMEEMRRFAYQPHYILNGVGNIPEIAAKG